MALSELAAKMSHLHQSGPPENGRGEFLVIGREANFGGAANCLGGSR